MAKQILLYDALYGYTASKFISELDAAKGNDIVVRMHSPGGDVYSTYGVLAAFKDFPGQKNIKVDGYANSAAAYFCALAMAQGNDVECLDVSTFIFHRASAGDWVENNKERFTDAIKAELNTINSNLRAMLEGITTPQKFKNITGVSMDDMFSLDARIDVGLDADKAKKMGLVSSVNKLTPKIKKEIQALDYRIAAFYDANTDIKDNDFKPTNNMEIKTLADFKAQYPALYAEAKAEGTTEELDRVSGYLAFGDVDFKAVKEGIESGKKPTQKFHAEMAIKQFSASTLQAMAAANKTPTTEEIPTGTPGTGAPATTDAEKAAAAARSAANIDAYKSRHGIK